MESDEPGLISQFYSGARVHPAGYTIQEVWEWDNSRLEKSQGYLPWLFPVHDRWQKSSNAPLLIHSYLVGFETNADLRAKYISSLRTMLRFYGLRIQSSSGTTLIEPAEDFDRRVAHWVTAGNHNYHRISRILRSLCLLGRKDCAEEFLNALRIISGEHPKAIGYPVLKHWRYSGFAVNGTARIRLFGEPKD
jgi:hypothetical protein